MGTSSVDSLRPKVLDGHALMSGARELPRVLLVDRHPAFRRGLSETLQAARAARVIAETDDGVEAAALATRLLPEVVFLDISLRTLSGLELTRRLSKLEGPPKIIVLSAHGEAGFVRVLLDAGADGYLSKEASTHHVLEALSVVLMGKRYLEPGPSGQARMSFGRRAVPPCGLSPREEQILRLLSRGQPAREVAEAVQLSERTVETYRLRAMTKLSLSGRADLVRFAVLNGWLEDAI